VVFTAGLEFSPGLLNSYIDCDPEGWKAWVDDWLDDLFDYWFEFGSL
jgi:hypothetical protein